VGVAKDDLLGVFPGMVDAVAKDRGVFFAVLLKAFCLSALRLLASTLRTKLAAVLLVLLLAVLFPSLELGLVPLPLLLLASAFSSVVMVGTMGGVVAVVAASTSSSFIVVGVVVVAGIVAVQVAAMVVWAVMARVWLVLRLVVLL